MNSVDEGNAATPAKPDDSVFLFRSGERHSVLRDGVELFLNPGRVECSDSRLGKGSDDAVRAAGKILHRQQIGSNGDESIGSELICNVAYPRRQSENLVHDQHYRGLATALRIDDPRANAVSVAGANHRPLSMTR